MSSSVEHSAVILHSEFMITFALHRIPEVGQDVLGSFCPVLLLKPVSLIAGCPGPCSAGF